MGARPSSFKRGGGYLNGVDVTLVGYTFLVGDAAEIKKGNRKGEMFTPLSLVPEFQEDGASETKTQRLLIGDATNFGDVSEDGLTLDTPDGQVFGASSEAGIFLASLCDSPVFPEDRFEDTNERINLEPMIGTRMRLVQEVNAEKTKRQGQQTGKDGKMYDRKDLKVGEVYSVAATGKAAKGKPVAGKKAAVVEFDAQDAADTVLPVIVEKAGGTLQKRQLSAKFQVTVTSKHPLYENRDAIRDLILSDDYLNEASERGIIEYDAKKQVLSVAA
jgi:hypothetical protein